ncbi:hypothetical protein [Bradyrhizobium sp. BRP23]|uniref:hypothetical protein n=1 Tax=Bradyrhizobium sp. BRP23 TaxID=2793820 RepID=UPI001CD2670A|nr:hypothetical protein [Bradyrhizobium sp. BRP23]MCA1381690.1 hypothetical protein [Bradyrhizobium sp. BRP05]MCA1417255.1 hypothetical protein [Bradyrhizobium sp. BRP23]
MKRLLFVGLVALQSIGIGLAHAQSDDLARRIELGMRLIKVGCPTGSATQKTEVKGNATGRITLLRPADASADASVNFTKEEAHGLVAALQKEVTDSGVKLSERQLDCLKPYIDRIFEELFPNKKSGTRDEKRLALADLHTAFRKIARHAYGEQIGPPLTYGVSINDDKIEISNRSSAYWARLGDLKPEPEFVTHAPGLPHLRLYCLLSDCVSQVYKDGNSEKRSYAPVYVKIGADPKPLENAFARVIRLY